MGKSVDCNGDGNGGKAGGHEVERLFKASKEKFNSRASETKATGITIAADA